MSGHGKGENILSRQHVVAKDIFTCFDMPEIIWVIEGHKGCEGNKKHTENHSGYGEKFENFLDHRQQVFIWNDTRTSKGRGVSGCCTYASPGNVPYLHVTDQ